MTGASGKLNEAVGFCYFFLRLERVELLHATKVETHARTMFGKCVLVDQASSSRPWRVGIKLKT